MMIIIWPPCSNISVNWIKEMTPFNESFTDEEFIVRNVYHTSQYSNKDGLKKNYLYPRYTKESTEFPGRHVCRVSVQRVCYGGWQGVTDMAIKTISGNQQLVGFSLAPASIIAILSTVPATVNVKSVFSLCSSVGLIIICPST